MNKISRVVSTLTATSAIFAVVLGGGLPANAEASDQRHAICATGELTQTNIENVDTADLPCDVSELVAVVDGYTLQIPSRGEWNSLSAVFPTDSPEEHVEVSVLRGEQDEIAIVNGDDTVTSVGADDLEKPIDSESQLAVGSGPMLAAAANDYGMCDDYDFDYIIRNYVGIDYLPTWDSTYTWYYNNLNQPSTSSLERIKVSAERVVNGDNHCGLTAGPNVFKKAKQSFAATSNTKAPMGGEGGANTCGDIDGRSVVGWRNRPTATWLALQCWGGNFYSQTITEGDITFNTKFDWFTGAGGADCTGTKYDLQGVALHEFGHVFGLEHVDQSSNQVMKPLIAPCEYRLRKLGLGDYNGLYNLYH